MQIRQLGTLMKGAFEEFMGDDALRLSAALSYYTIFSMAPLLVILIAVAGLFFGQEAARGEVQSALQGVMGPQAAEAIGGMIETNSEREGGGLALGLGLLTLLIGASGAFAQLQAALNEVWQVEAKPGASIKGFLRKRLLSFLVVLVIGVMLLLLLALSAVLSGVSGDSLGGWSAGALRAVELGGTFVFVTLFFAFIFRVLPDVEISWRDVGIGAAATALLFVLGKYLIGLYLGMSSVGSAYGAAGSLAVLLVWIYYSAAILFFGAELTQVWARDFGDRIRPDEHAVRVREVVEEPEPDGGAEAPAPRRG